MVKAPLTVLALAGPTFASVVQRGEGHGEKPHVWEKGPHSDKPSSWEKPTGSHSPHWEQPTEIVTQPHWYTKTSTYVTTDCPGMSTA